MTNTKRCCSPCRQRRALTEPMSDSARGAAAFGWTYPSTDWRSTGLRPREDYWAVGTVENRFGADDSLARVLEEHESPI